MKTQKIVAAASLFLAMPLQAQVFNYTFTPNLDIPDGNAVGVSDVQTISLPATSIESVKVTLDITGSFNGDLYVYLRHDSGFSVLLNRPGRETGNLFGYDDKGFNITLRDDATRDVHNYQNFEIPGSGLKLTGEWKPDARATEPSAVLASDLRTANLSAFQGFNPNGQWTLFAADLVNSGTSQITSWGMEITVVPEPQAIALASGAALAAFGFWWRRRKV